MRGEHAGIVMPVTSRRRNQRGEPVEQLERGEGELGLAGGQRLGEAIADVLIGAVPGESFTGEGGTGAVAQQPFEAGAVRSLDQDGGVQREPAAVAPAGEVGGDLDGAGLLGPRPGSPSRTGAIEHEVPQILGDFVVVHELNGTQAIGGRCHESAHIPH